ncbi:hypothetical protein HRbin26_01024 [bacterium HR26]|nr:hypothetical protein HRbin26_01024 [bacterium HR26]
MRDRADDDVALPELLDERWRVDPLDGEAHQAGHPVARGDHGDAWQFAQRLPGVLPQLGDAPVGPLVADELADPGQAGRLAGDRRQVDAAGLEPLGGRLGQQVAAGDLQPARRQRCVADHGQVQHVHRLVGDVDRPGPLWPAEPLLARDRVDIHSERGQVHRDRAGRLGAVDGHQDPLAVRERDDLLERENGAGVPGQVGDNDHAGAPGEQALDRSGNVPRAVAQPRRADDHAVAVGHVEDRALAARVLHVGGDDLVARLPVDPHHREVHAVGGVAGEGDVAGAAAEQASDLFAGLLLDLGGALVALGDDPAVG